MLRAAWLPSLLALLLAGLLPQGSTQQPQADDGWLAGTLGELGYGTTYAADQGGCGYGPLPLSQWPFGGIAAVDPLASPFATGVQQGCGVCLEVQCTDPTTCGTSQPLLVLVTDHCDGCGAGAVYLAPAAFGQLVPGPLGSVAGRFRRVPCNPPGPITVRVDQYGANWMRLALRNVAGSGDIAGVALAPSSNPTAWVPMQHSFGAAWEASNLPPPPVDLRVTDSSGQQVVARRVLAQAGEAGSFPTDAQFQATQALAAALGGTVPALSPSPATFSPSPAELPPASPAFTLETLPPLPQPAPAPAPEALPPAPEAPLAPVVPPQPEAGAAVLESPALPLQPKPAIAAITSPAPPPQPEAGAAVPESPALPLQPEPATAALTSPAPPPQPKQPLTVQLVAALPEASPLPFAAAPLTEPAVPPAGTAPAPPSPAFTLPPPAQAAPEIVDTRPARPPGVGPSISPAPTNFSAAPGLPTVRPLPPSSGPASARQLVGPAFNASCSTIGDILSRIPEASNWTQLLSSAGLSMLLESKSAQVTLLVPINSALSAEIDARPLRLERNLSELILNAPEIINPLVGYHVLPRLWPSSTLQPGTAIDTSDTIDKVNRLQVTALGATALQGIGSSARILQGDIAACGPAVIHVIDQARSCTPERGAVLLPFTFNQSAIDAITGTQAPLANASLPGALPVAGRR